MVGFNNCSDLQPADLSTTSNSTSPGVIDTILPEVGEISQTAQRFECRKPQERAVKTPSRRLMKFELENTVESIVGKTVKDRLANSLNLYPKENFAGDVEAFNRVMGSASTDAILSLAFSLPAELLAHDPATRSVLPACLFTNSQPARFRLDSATCKEEFIRKTGLKFHRRPLTENEVTTYLNLLNANDSALKYNFHRINAVLSAMVLNPHFVTILTYQNEPVADRHSIDAFSLASRISYAAAGTAPDSALMAAAQNNSLNEKSVRKAHATRLINSSYGRKYVRDIFRRLLKLGKESVPNQKYAAHLNLTTDNLLQDLRKEALDFVEYIVFEKEGSFQDLVTEKVSFPPSQNTADLLGVERVSSGVKDPVVNKGIRAGVFLRPILMIASEARTSPIHRGNFFLSEMLCQKLPEPGAELLAEADKLTQELDLSRITSRGEAEHITKSTTCMGCHSSINPPGFVAEAFGSLGEFRQTESIFTAEGQFIRNLNIDTRTEFRVDGQELKVENAEDLVSFVAKSTTGQSCFAIQLFRQSNLTSTDSSSHCHLASLETQIRNGKSVKSAMIENAISEDLMWQKQQ